MADHSKQGSSDTGAAFVGLIGGALFIGIIVYVIVLLTNKKFEGHAAPTSSIPAAMAVVA